MTAEPTDPPTDPHDEQPPQPATGFSFRVPACLEPRTLDDEHVTATSIEAACAWDARLWKRGMPRTW